MAKSFATDQVQWVTTQYKPDRTEADVLLKWSLQLGFVPLVTSEKPAHMMSNLEVASWTDWKLSDNDMSILASLENEPQFTGGQDLSGDEDDPAAGCAIILPPPQRPFPCDHC